MEGRRYSKRKWLREYNVPVEEHIEAGDYSVSPVYKLPDHLFLRIFSYLPLRDRCRIQRVCKFWQKLSVEAWKTYNTLTLSLEDWGCRLSFNFSIDKYLVLSNILKAHGSSITCIDLSRSRRFTVWELMPTRGKSLFAAIGNQCPNLTTINLGVIGDVEIARPLLQSAKKLDELVSHANNWSNCVRLINDLNLRKLVIHSILHDASWNYLNPQTVEEIDTIMNNVNIQFCRVLKNWVNLKSISVSSAFQPLYDSTTDIALLLESLMSVEKSLKRIEIIVFGYSDYYMGPPYNARIDSSPINRFKNIETLELSGRGLFLSNEFFEAVGKNCHSLTRVRLEALAYVDDVKMLYITELPKLEELKVAYLEMITDMIFTNNLFALKKLRCAHCRSLRGFGLCEFIQRSKTIESIEITQCENVCIEKVVGEAKLITESRTDGPPLRIIIE